MTSAKNKFTGKAEVYAKYRSDYPEDYLNYLVETNHLDSKSIVADIGSGTGILTRQLLNKNLRVTAVEPNDDMRIAAEKSLKNYSWFTSLASSAEHIQLPDASVDLITVAQAFHWFDQGRFKMECQRVLKCNKNVALVWNSRDFSSKLITENAEICRKLCPSFRGFSGGMEDTSEIYRQFFRNGHYEYKEFPNHLVFDLEGFIGRNISGSYAPKKGDATYEKFIQAITDLFYKHSKGNVLSMPNLTRSYLGKV